MSNYKSIHVPYIKKITVDDPTMSLEEAKKLEKELLEKPEFKGFRLKEIQGSRLALIDDEWCELGYNLLFEKNEWGNILPNFQNEEA